MTELQNPLVAAGEFLVREAEGSEQAQALDQLFAGSLSEMEQRWAGTAVLDNVGAWHVVRVSGHVRDEGVRRVMLHSGGAFSRGPRLFCMRAHA